MKSYQQLTREQRYQIYALAGHPRVETPARDRPDCRAVAASARGRYTTPRSRRGRATEATPGSGKSCREVLWSDYSQRAQFGRSYDYDRAHRTNNLVDRLMKFLD